MYINRIFTLFWHTLLLFIIFSLTRLIFYFFNYNSFSDADTINIFKGFVWGLRFDLSVILITNSIFIIIAIIPFEYAVINKVVYSVYFKLTFLFVNGTALFINIADACYFPIKGRRTDLEVLGIWKDVQDQALQLSFNYWYLWLILLVLILMICLGNRFIESTNKHKLIMPLYARIMISLVLIPAIILGIRGGFQLKPLRPNMAFVLSPNSLGNLVLNTPFLMIHNSQLPTVSKKQYYPNEKICLQNFVKPYGNPANYKPNLIKKPNLVLIILESFSSEYTGFGNSWTGFTPFLDSISAHGLFFANHFSNGRTSIEALPALLANIPSLMDESYITSSYQSNSITGIASILKQNGYQTAFFHGGKNGTMGFDVFSKNAGFEKYYGLNEYPNPSLHFDGNWGIFDHHYLQYFSKELSKMQEPFFGSVFTLSSHQPYNLPDALKDQFAEGPLPVIKTIKYADYALKCFFENAQKKEWFDNTIFIITADHVQEKIQPWSIYNDYHVPFLMYAPKLIKSVLVKNRLTQHLDLPSTILDLLNLPTYSIYKFGHSVFDKDYDGKAILYDPNSGNALLAGMKMSCLWTQDNQAVMMKTKNEKYDNLDSTKIKLLEREYVQEIKAIQQFHNNGLLENSWFRNE